MTKVKAQQGCEYCALPMQNREFLHTEDDEAYLSIGEENTPYVETNTNVYYMTQKFRFCPMCGRKLEVKDDERS